MEERAPQRSTPTGWIVTHYSALAILTLLILFPILAVSDAVRGDGDILRLIVSFAPLILIGPIVILVSFISGLVAAFKSRPGPLRVLLIITSLLIGILAFPLILIAL